MKIGIDFDNTLAGYDALFLSMAVRNNLLPAGFRGSKQVIRDAIRDLENGEQQWQRLQGLVYGPHMLEAEMLPGVMAFLAACRTNGCDVFVVSHKTEYGHFDDTRTNLRQQAMRWLSTNGFFQPDRSPLTEQRVFFEATREAKVARISSLGVDVFIDDLIEVFEHPDFPARIQGILFTNGAMPTGKISVRACPTWPAITATLESMLQA